MITINTNSIDPAERTTSSIDCGNREIRMQNSGIPETSLPTRLAVLVFDARARHVVGLAQVCCFTEPSYCSSARIWPSLIRALDRSSALID
jgi:hypothetical protein